MAQYDFENYDPPAPIADVKLRLIDAESVTSDAVLLIDTGADVTLLPRRVAAQLGILSNTAEQYELVGFDGSRIMADAVELELLFCRKAFRGRYLLTDDKRGILGRDVLASLALTFDGPARAGMRERRETNEM